MRLSDPWDDILARKAAEAPAAAAAPDAWEQITSRKAAEARSLSISGKVALAAGLVIGFLIFNPLKGRK